MGNCLKKKQREAANHKDHENQSEKTDKFQVTELTLVEDEVKAKWTREQNKLKQAMVISDVDQWSRQRLIADDAHDCSAGHLQYVGGVDISFVKGDDVNACAALVVLSLPDLKVVHEDMAMVQLTAPYIPGFLAFREVQFLVDRFENIKQNAPQFLPQVILVDGNGILHHRGFGQACHLGVMLDLPCVGVAKNLLQVDGLEKNSNHTDKIKELKVGGDSFPLVGSSGDILGKALRTTDASTNPVYVSPGHRISLDTAVWLAHRCSKHRVPEPVRQADIRSREYLRINFKPED